MSWCCPAILLHRAKADLTLLDENRNTALHLACSKVHVSFSQDPQITGFSKEYLSVDILLFYLFIYFMVICFIPQAHEMCALLILGEIHSPTLINATNSALQM